MLTPEQIQQLKTSTAAPTFASNPEAAKAMFSATPAKPASSYEVAMGQKNPDGTPNTSPGILSQAFNQAKAGYEQTKAGVNNPDMGAGIQQIGRGILNEAGAGLRAAFSPVEAVTKIVSQLPGIHQVVGGVDAAVQKVADHFGNNEQLQAFMQNNPNADEVIGNLIGIGSAVGLGKLGAPDGVPATKLGGAIESGIDTLKTGASDLVSKVKPSIDMVKGKLSTPPGETNQAIFDARAKDIYNIENNYAKTRKSMDYSSDANAASRARVASTDVLVGSTDNTGTIRTKQPGGAVDQYKAQTLDGSEKLVRDNLAIEGKTVPLETVEAKLKENIMNSGLEGRSLRTALNQVKGEVAGLKLRANPDGTIKLENIQDAKIATTNGIDYNTPPDVKAQAKATANTYKTLIEDHSSLPIRATNVELGKYLQDVKLLESLDGKKVEGGRLGTHFARIGGQVVGSMVGGAMGGGIPGMIGGGVAGGEAAGMIQGKIMGSTFGKETGAVAPKNAVLEDAKSYRLNNATPVDNIANSKPTTNPSNISSDTTTIKPKSQSLKVKGENPPTNSQQEFTNPRTGEFTPERQRLHDSIINKQINSTTPEKNPTAHIITGHSAAGKSKLVEGHIIPDPKYKNYVTIDADYLKAELGGKNPYFHDEGSNLAERLAYEVANGRRNFNFVGNIKDTPKYQQLLDFLKRKGYNIEASVVKTDLQTALTRNAARKGHAVPPEVVKQTYGVFNKGVDMVKNYTKDIKIYDGTKDFKTQYK